MQTTTNKPYRTAVFQMSNVTTLKGWGTKELIHITEENSVLAGYSKAKDQQNCTNTVLKLIKIFLTDI